MAVLRRRVAPIKAGSSISLARSAALDPTGSRDAGRRHAGDAERPPPRPWPGPRPSERRRATSGTPRGRADRSRPRAGPRRCRRRSTTRHTSSPRTSPTSTPCSTAGVAPPAAIRRGTASCSVGHLEWLRQWLGDRRQQRSARRRATPRSAGGRRGAAGERAGCLLGQDLQLIDPGAHRPGESRPETACLAARRATPNRCPVGCRRAERERHRLEVAPRRDHGPAQRASSPAVDRGVIRRPSTVTLPIAFRISVGAAQSVK